MLVISTNTNLTIRSFVSGRLYKEIAYYTFISITNKKQNRGPNVTNLVALDHTMLCFS